MQSFFGDLNLKKAQINRKDFDKEYMYYLKHNYGKVGKQTSYSPYGCQKLITLPMNGSHGCPYRTLSEKALQETLTLKGINDDQSKFIVQLAQKKEYLGACRMVFDILHPGIENEFKSHPNQYFKSSRVYFNGMNTENIKINTKREYHLEKIYGTNNNNNDLEIDS